MERRIMRGLKWRGHVVALVGVLSICIVAMIGAQKTVERSEQFRVGRARASYEIVAGAMACQSFRAEYPGLAAVYVPLATFERENTGTLIWRLRDDADPSRDLATSLLQVAAIEDGFNHEFAFPPMPDSEGRELRFCLEMPLGEEGNALAVWGTTTDAYEYGTAVFEGMGRRAIDDLVFQLDYRFRFPATLLAIARRLATNKPSIWGRSEFYVGLAGAHLLLAYLFLYRLVPRQE